jgi:TRAP-type C4-dicarboxylate transport system permease small subunit
MNVERASAPPATIFTSIEKWVRYIGNALLYCSIFLFVALMLLDTADVVGRYVFDSPIIGTMEISQVMMGGIVMLGWAYTQRNKGHVFVDMFINKYPPRARTTVDLIMLVFSLALFVAITYQSFILGMQHWESHRVFPTLRVTSVPFYFFVPAGGFFMCLEIIIQIINLAIASRRRG